MNRPLLLVLGDSLSFHGPDRAEPADDPRLWPNVAAAALCGRAELVAGIGWTARHAWHAITHDPRVWTLFPHVDALVLAVGGMDTLPSPLPTAQPPQSSSVEPLRCRMKSDCPSHTCASLTVSTGSSIATSPRLTPPGPPHRSSQPQGGSSIVGLPGRSELQASQRGSWSSFCIVQAGHSHIMGMKGRNERERRTFSQYLTNLTKNV